MCAYTSLEAQLAIETPKKTAVTVLVDKEEIGSVGATGMGSLFFENTIAEIAALAGLESPLALRRVWPHRACFPPTCPPASTCVCFGIRNEERCIPCKGLVFNKVHQRERAEKAAPTMRVPNTWHTYAA